MQKRILSSKVVLSLVAFLFILLSCELISRQIEKRYFFSTKVYLQKAKPLLHRISDIPGISYELIPNTRMENEFFSINSRGIRDKEYEIPKPDNVYRIIIVGDSVTFGTEYEINQTYPKILERMLNKKQNQKMKFEVLNAGVCSYNAIQKFLFFKHRLLEYDPDLVIFQFLNDDYYHNAVILPENIDNFSEEVPTSIGEYFAANMPKISILPLRLDRMLLRYSAFYRILNKRIYDARSFKNPEKYIPEVYKFSADIALSDSMRINRQAFAEFLKLSKESNFEFVVLLVPELVNIDKIDPWIKNDAPKEYGFQTIDLFKSFKKRNVDLELLRIMPQGTCHFNPNGHKITATIIKEWISEHLVL